MKVNVVYIALVIFGFVSLSEGAAATCGELLESVTHGQARETIEWTSEHLRNERPASAGRVKEIIDGVYEDDGAIGREISALRFPALFRTNRVRLFYQTYEVFSYSPLHQSVVDKFDHELPREGNILDLGGALGFSAARWESGRPGRVITILDSGFREEEGSYEAFVRRRLPRGTDIRIVRQEISKRTERLDVADLQDAVAVNHAFYYPQVPPEKWMALVHGVLKEGGRLFLNEPGPGDYRKWLTSVVVAGMENGAPHTEFEIAYFAAFCSGRFFGLGKPAYRFLTSDEWSRHARDAGFIVESTSTTHEGFSNFLVLRKPTRN